MMDIEEQKVKGVSYRKAYSIYFVSMLLIIASAFAGYSIGVSHERAYQADPTVQRSGEPSYAVLRQVWSVLNREFYGDLTSATQADGAVQGMVASLGDPFTVYLPPKDDAIFRDDLKGSFGGIGAELEMRNGLVTVVAPLPGTPAERAGLQASDVLVKVGEKETKDLNLDDVITLIRGEVGTSVSLTILREGTEGPVVVDITRDTIVVKSIESSPLAGGQVDYIKISQFGDDTLEAFRDAVENTAKDGAKALVIDLRNNPGGYLESASSMIGMLIPNEVNSTDSYLKKRTTVREKTCNYSGSGSSRACAAREIVTTTDESAVLPSLPIVLLVNRGSASASEIFAGALRDYNRAKIVGTTTYGKGSVQDLVPLDAGGSVKVTVAHWLTPLGLEINKIGVKPDIEATLAEGVQPSKDDAQVTAALQSLGY